ncbi:MAG: hypothetical protein C5S48_04895 [Candidatus Methanogaster sp.]|nr:MAG: hypothetical protein C5S48_04895 [ANME-2 cluster archaeon]
MIGGIIGGVIVAAVTYLFSLRLLKRKLERENAVRFLTEHYLPLLGTLQRVIYAWYVWAEVYLFNWDNIPGNDSDRLLMLLKSNYSPPTTAKFIINEIIFLIAMVVNKTFRLMDGDTVYRPTHDEIHAAYQQGEEAVIQLCDYLSWELQTMQDQLNKNSKNSSKPPSSDGFKKTPRTKSQRKPGNKKNGGQDGHVGHTLEPVEEPDHIEVHVVDRCTVCGATLEGVEVDDYQKRQVFDIPPIKIEVTEHQAEIKTCPHCNARNMALFPPDVTASVQYGNRFRAMAVYQTNYQFVPLERAGDFFEDVFGHRLG